MKLRCVSWLNKRLLITRVNQVNLDKKENQDFQELAYEDLK